MPSLVLGKTPVRAPVGAPVQAAVVEGRDGWLFLGDELHLLGVETFWAA